MISDSIMFIFCSLTISSAFLLFFVILLLKSELWRKKRQPASQRSRRKNRDIGVYSFRSVAQETEGGKKDSRFVQHQVANMEHRGERPDKSIEFNRNSVQKRGEPTKNKTLSLNGTINGNNFQGRPEKSWLKIDAQSSKDDGSFKYQGTSDFENQISSVDKADFSAQSIQKEFFEDTMPKRAEHASNNSNYPHPSSLSNTY